MSEPTPEMYQRAAELTHRILFRIAREKAISAARASMETEAAA